MILLLLREFGVRFRLIDKDSGFMGTGKKEDTVARLKIKHKQKFSQSWTAISGIRNTIKSLRKQGQRNDF
jgi:hypothetical protein